MAVAVTCQCQTTYELKDDLAGKLVKCPQCGTDNRVPTTVLTPKSQVDPVYDRDVFLLRQKAMTINEKYIVTDEEGQNLVFVERPAHFLRNLLALILGIVAAAIVGVGFTMLAGYLSINVSERAGAITALLMLPMAFITMLLVGTGISKKRHVEFYRGGEEKGEKLMQASQDKKFEFFTTTFTLRDGRGRPLARIRKNLFSNMLRKKWRMFSLAGRPLLIAKEDSIILSLLRRLLGPLFGLLRTNFVFTDGTDRNVGEFQRKMTILDRYALDLRADHNRSVDRRFALAMGVLLDTGERR
jgi:uncharacterized protein YxjI